MTRILAIEDDPDIQELLRWNLEREGYEVIMAGSGDQGLAEVRRQKIDLILLDLMLPDRDGLEICRIMRSTTSMVAIPVIMLTAKNDEDDLLVGFGMGADDYMTKPFRPKELLARIKARLFRMTSESMLMEPQRLQIDRMVIDHVRHNLTIDGRQIPVTLTEFRLVHFLASHLGRVHSRRSILGHITDGGSSATDRTIDVHIRNLRRKIRPYDRHIEAIRGVGYRFRESALDDSCAMLA